MRASLLVFFAFLLISPGPARAADETNREIARTFAIHYIQQKELQSGWSVLRDHLEADPADAGAWNLLGLIYLEADQPAYALKALYRAVEKASQTDPERGIYLYNYADAAIRAGNETQARDLLVESASFPQTRATAKLALGELKAGNALPVFALESQSHWDASAAFLSGYDSNVLLFSDSTLSAQTASGAASPTLSALVQVQNARSFADWSWIASFTHYQAEEARQFNNFATSLNSEWGKENEEFAVFDGSLGNQFDLAFMNTNGFQFFNWTETLRWRGTLRHSLRAETEVALPLSYQKFLVEAGDDPFDDRTGWSVAPALVHSRTFGASRFSAGIRLEAQLPKGDNYRSFSFAMPMNFSRTFGGSWGAAFSLEPQFANYVRSATARRDRGLKTGVALSRTFGDAISASLDYSFRRNISNVELATYSRHSLMLMVNYALF